MSHGDPPSQRLTRTPHTDLHTHNTTSRLTLCRDTPALRRGSGPAPVAVGGPGAHAPSRLGSPARPRHGPAPPPQASGPAAGWLRFPRKRCHCSRVHSLQGLQCVPDRSPEPAWDSGTGRHGLLAGEKPMSGRGPAGGGRPRDRRGEAGPARQGPGSPRPGPLTPSRPAQAAQPTSPRQKAFPRSLLSWRQNC